MAWCVGSSQSVRVQRDHGETLTIACFVQGAHRCDHGHSSEPRGSPPRQRQLGHQPPHLAYRSVTDYVVHGNCDLQSVSTGLLIPPSLARIF